MEEKLQGTKQEFIKIFRELCYSRSSWQVWADLISAMACSLANVTDRTEPRYSNREKEYAECIKRLGGVERVSKLFAIITLALERNQDQDFLGSLYMELELGNHWKGQFFTPYSICQLMAEINIPNADETIKQKGWMAVNDPACGAGATLIAAANTFRRKNINYQQEVLFVAQDIDRVVGMMCFIQLSLLGCPGYVVIANTLTNPTVGEVLIPAEQDGQEFWYTPFYFMDIWQFRRKFQYMDMMFRNIEKTGTNKSEDIFYMYFKFGKGIDDMAENTTGKVKKAFVSGAEKLRFEQEECVKNINDKYKDIAKKQYGMVFSVLIKQCEDDKEFDTLVLQEHKSWGRCMKFCSEKAMEICNPTDKQKELARKGEQPIAAPVDSVTLFQWIDEYYRMDDKDKIEKEKKAEAKKEADAKKKEEQNKKAEEKKTPAEGKQKKPSEPKDKGKQKEPTGQMSLFDLL